MNSRRQFLKCMLGLIATGGIPARAFAKGSGELPAPAHPSAGPLSLKLGSRSIQIANWTGDNFEPGHRFRDNELPKFPEAAERKVDFVIIGGGIGGLSSAFYLNDHDYLLLEQYQAAGGQSRGGNFQGVKFSYGPAYVSSVEGIYGKLYDDLGIAPVKIPAGDNAFFWQGKWQEGLNSRAKDQLHEQLSRLMANCAAGIKQLPADDTPEAMTAGGAISVLEEEPFSHLAKGYSPEFKALIDSICRSNLCGSTDSISAAAGCYLVQDLSTELYAFKGGNQAISSALVDKSKKTGAGRVVTGAFVWSVQLKESGADVLYTAEDGEAHRVACKHVIVATPPMVAWRQLANLSDKMRARLMPFKYGSYLVANFLFSKPVFSGAFDNWVGSPLTISDIIVVNKTYKLCGAEPQSGAFVLTAYHPWSPGGEGRPLLLAGDRHRFAADLCEQLGKVVPGFERDLKEIVLSRWGHAMPVTTPGYYRRLAEIQAGYDGPYSFAHSSTQGMPSAESAIRAGKFASQRAKQLASRTAMTVVGIAQES